MIKQLKFQKKFNLFFFFLFIIKNYNLFFNNLFFNNLFFIYKKINYFYKNNTMLNFAKLEKKTTNHELGKIIYKYAQNFTEQRKTNILNFKKINTNLILIENKKKLTHQLINLFFLFNVSLFNSKFKKSGFFNFFYLKDNKGKTVIINIKKFLFRWNNSFNLLYNVFFYNLNPLFYSSPLFRNETIGLNWYYHKWNYSFWKYCYNFFIFKTNKFNKKINYFYEKIKDLEINFFIVTDSLYHFKNLFYFSNFQFYTIGLIPSSINPWIVSYPIISFFDNYLIQLFFFKLIIYLNKQALLKKFFFFQKTWTRSLFSKYNI